MKKFIVETYYTCTFKTLHKLDDLNDQELSKINDRTDGDVEVIDVKLNNRKTKKIGDLKNENSKNIKIKNSIPESIKNKIKNKKQKSDEAQSLIKVKNNARFKMPDRRKGYIQKAQIGDHKFIYILENMTW